MFKQTKQWTNVHKNNTSVKNKIIGHKEMHFSHKKLCSGNGEIIYWVLLCVELTAF